MRPQSTRLNCPSCDAEVPLATFHGPVLDQPGVLLASCGECEAHLALTWAADAMTLSIAQPQSAARVRQAVPALEVLLAALDEARAAMRRALDARPSDARQQTDARRRLQDSLEAYAAALTKRNLPIPVRLRDEITLQRGIVSRTDALGRLRPAAQDPSHPLH